MAEQEATEKRVVTIKKYANRRLYNTATSSYVTLDHLSQMVKDGVEFVVFDAKTSEDITRSVLTQIIVEEESKGQNLLPISFLRQLIALYGHSMQWMVPRYLEHSMDSFSSNQARMREYMQSTFGGVFPFGSIEEMSKQNIAMFERAMRMFSPFAATADTPPGTIPAESEQPTGPGSDDSKSASDQAISDLQHRLDELQRQLGSLTATSDKPD